MKKNHDYRDLPFFGILTRVNPTHGLFARFNEKQRFKVNVGLLGILHTVYILKIKQSVIIN